MFSLVVVVSFFAMVLGMFSPRLVIHWGNGEKKTRGKVLLVYGCIFLFSFLALGILEGPTQEASVKLEARSKDMRKETRRDESKTQFSPPTAKWNIKEMDASRNGNIAVAVKQLKAMGDCRGMSVSVITGDVVKAPWNYYGKVLQFRGEVAIVQEYPPRSDVSKLLGGAAAEIILVAADDTIVDFFITGSSGNVRVGDVVTIYGFPVGLLDVENKMGGKTTQLAVVGNSFNKN